MDKNIKDYKVGDESPTKTGKISKIFRRTSTYMIYEVGKTGEISYSSQNSSGDSLREIKSIASDIGFILGSKRQKRKYISQISSAYGEAIEGRVEEAKIFLAKLKENIIKEKNIKCKLSYLLSCLFFVVINIIIAILVNFVFSELINPSFIKLFTVTTFGSLGGFLSVSIRINHLELDAYESHIIQIWTGFSRIFISMVSSLILFAIIKSDFAFGFIGKMNTNFAIYSFASVAGFSEYFVPNILNKIKNGKTTDDKN